MDIHSTVANLKSVLARQGTSTRAAQEKRYLKSSLDFLGATVPIVRRTAKTFAREQPAMDRVTLKRLTEGLWHTNVHELRSLAVAILEQRLDLLRPADAAWLIGIVNRSDTWAHVDWLSVKVIGGLVARTPIVAARLNQWARHKNFWVRRTALLALHDQLIAGAGDFAQFARLAALMLDEREFFIRKAIGWVLRSTARKTPERTIAFVEEHAPAMAALTFNEATRTLPPAQQRRLRTLRDAGATTKPASRKNDKNDKNDKKKQKK
jgi:3-methyladenine DNA glycosylase AlkD